MTATDAGAAETRRCGVSVEDVAALDEWVEAVGRRWGKSDRVVFAARLCIAELAGNVVEHGASTSADDHMIVTLHCRPDGLGIAFLDSCAPFDPTRSGDAPPAQSAEGGRGLMLIRAYAKELCYRRDGAYNRVALCIAPA